MDRSRLRAKALRLEWLTIGWNGAEFVITLALGFAARSLALIGFGLDTLVELFASVIVVWHLRGDEHPGRTRRAHRLIAGAFATIAVLLVAAAIRALAVGHQAGDSPLGIAYIAVTAAVMVSLGLAKRRVAQSMADEVLASEAVMSILDAVLALGVLAGLILNSAAGWWWADPAATLVVALFAVNEARENLEKAREIEEAGS